MGRRGLVGLYTTHGAKGRWFTSRLFLFFFVGTTRQLETKTYSAGWNDVDREDAKNAGAATKKMDEPAGKRGVATRNEKEGSS